MLTTFGIVGDYYIKQFASKENFNTLTYVYGVITPIGKVGQFALIAGVAYYVIFNWARFNWQTALMFAFCTNYFLPQYLMAGIASAGWILSSPATRPHMGCNMSCFSAFMPSGRITNATRRRAKKISVRSCCSRSRQRSYVSPIFGMPAVFCRPSGWAILSAVRGRRPYIWHPDDQCNRNRYIAQPLLAEPYFWRFRDSASCNWMLARYAFLFRNRKMTAPVVTSTP